MININGQIEKLQAASASLTAKVDELNSAVLATDDDAISNLKDKLKAAVDALNEDIKTKKFAIKLLPFVKGSLRFFNNHTNN